MNKEICRFTCSKCKKLRTEDSYCGGVCSSCRERSKREDSYYCEWGSTTSWAFHKEKEMRCSEHCGNTVRDK